MADALERGRSAFGLHEWVDAYAALSDAAVTFPLDAEDLERLAVAAHLVGKDDDSVDAWARAHQAWAQRDEPGRAARCAIWLGFGLLLRGDEARGGGWLARARRLVADLGPDCAERGLLLVPDGLDRLAAGDVAGAEAAFREAVRLGDRFRDPDVATFGRLGLGQALIAAGRAAAGVASLDDAMVAVAAGEVSPVVVGIVYCAVILECQSLGDARRAHEWTRALSRWCASQPGLVPYRGQCLVHRSEIMALHGDWRGADHEAQEACELLVGHPAAGFAHYQRAELHRLRGEFDRADDAYRQASRLGQEPQPGLALLRLAQGQVGAAEAAIRRVADHAGPGAYRARLLAACVEILLAAGDGRAARGAADDLMSMATELDTPALHALAGHATGSVLLHDGDAREAGRALRRACARWLEVEAPYEAARTRVLHALACRALGDEDTAAMELDAARSAFRELGARPDLDRVDTLSPSGPAPRAGGLTAREVEVLALVASGKSNREVATELVISEHTVARHLQNIFVKLGVSSRTAASAFAHEHRLL